MYTLFSVVLLTYSTLLTILMLALENHEIKRIVELYGFLLVFCLIMLTDFTVLTLAASNVYKTYKADSHDDYKWLEKQKRRSVVLT